jgi:quinol monooxygenase YgiN
MTGTSALAVVAVFTAKPADAAEVEAQLRRLIEPTRAEDGCLRYELNRAAEPGVWFFTEIWASAEAHARHVGTEHIKQMLHATLPLLAGPIQEYKGEILAG